MSEEEQKPQMVRINVEIPKELHTRLRLQAIREGSDLKRLVPRLLEKACPPEEGKKGGESRAIRYQEGGLPAGRCSDRNTE